MDTYLSEVAAGVENSKIRRMFNMASGMADVINLGIGEPDFDTPAPIVRAAIWAMKHGRTHYTANAGIPELRTSIAEKATSANYIRADPDKNVIITNGSIGALYLVLRSVIDKGDEVLLPRPSWTNYEAQIAMSSGKIVPVCTSPQDGFLVTLDSLAAAISPRTKALIINTPHNPTGTVYTRDLLEGISELSIKHDFLIVSDEVYEKYVWDGTPHVSIASFPGMISRTITINSFSKSYAMTGWRVGYAIGPENIVRAMTKLQESVYACPCAISQWAAIAAVERDYECSAWMIEEYRRRRQYVLAEIHKNPSFELVVPHGSFYLFPKIRTPGIGSDKFALELLRRQKVCVVPGTAFGPEGEGFIRLSYTANMENLATALHRINGFLSDILEEGDL